MTSASERDYQFVKDKKVVAFNSYLTCSAVGSIPFNGNMTLDDLSPRTSRNARYLRERQRYLDLEQVQFSMMNQKMIYSATPIGRARTHGANTQFLIGRDAVG
jgi:hypothetical protein